MFAKLYGEDENQILVKLDTSEEGKPEVRFYTEPGGFGVCSIAIRFSDSDEGWDKAEKVFSNVNEETAFKMAKQIVDNALSKRGGT